MNFMEIIFALEKVIVDIKSYVRLDMVTQADGDSGDSAQRTGTLYAMTALLDKPSSANTLMQKHLGMSYEKSMAVLEAAPGVYRRSSDPAHWGYNSNNFSRDQWSILQLAFAANGDKKRLVESMKALIGRKLLHQNVHPGTDAAPDFRKFPDVAHPSHFSVFIRGMGWWWMYPILAVIDLLLLADVALRCFHDPANDADNMLAQQLLYAQKYTTPASYVAMQIYRLTNWRTKLRAYHGPARNGIPPLAALIELAYDVKTGSGK